MFDRVTRPPISGGKYARPSELEAAYLAATDPYGGSGFRGDAERWRTAREVILAAIDRSGSLLDVGCANGLLLESLVSWGAERGLAIDPWGPGRVRRPRGFVNAQAS